MSPEPWLFPLPRHTDIESAPTTKHLWIDIPSVLQAPGLGLQSAKKISILANWLPLTWHATQTAGNQVQTFAHGVIYFRALAYLISRA